MTDHQMFLPYAAADPSPRAALIARWNTLVRKVLPGMAQTCGWPISLDHCFMRVCLDTALSAPWHLIVRRPAIRHLTDEQLAAAITVAEGLVRAPETLEALNRQSIGWRKQARAQASSGTS